ncbi:hypothetical protein L0337_10630 [candidate division KSB1 bacterium]|nr:hypothetical protein [candidate division KSB1 bacterium]
MIFAHGLLIFAQIILPLRERGKALMHLLLDRIEPFYDLEQNLITYRVIRHIRLLD